MPCQQAFCTQTPCATMLIPRKHQRAAPDTRVMRLMPALRVWAGRARPLRSVMGAPPVAPRTSVADNEVVVCREHAASLLPLPLARFCPYRMLRQRGCHPGTNLDRIDRLARVGWFDRFDRLNWIGW